MKVAVDQLVESLDELQKLYGQLYEIGLQKKEVIMGDRVDELTGILARESRLLKRFDEHDQARARAVVALQKESGHKANPQATLTQVGALLSDPGEREKLAEVRRKLAETAKSLKQLNALNQQLIRQSIDFIEYSLDLMVGPVEEEPVYRNPNSRPPSSNRTGGFDYRA